MNLKDFAERAKALDDLRRTQGKELFLAALKEAFEAHPIIEAVRWEQGTPSLNDGDPCVFGINEPRYKQVESGGAAPPDDDDGFAEVYYYEKGPLKAADADFSAVINMDERLMELAFGDCVQVTINRALEVEIEESSFD